jgi:hypothetical protein
MRGEGPHVSVLSISYLAKIFRPDRVYGGKVSRVWRKRRFLLELSVRWYTVVYILGIYIECLPRVS